MSRKLYKLKGLSKARRRKGLTQSDLAALLGIHPKSVMNWEQGIANPPLDTFMELADALDCDLDYLAGRLSEPTHSFMDLQAQTGLSFPALRKLKSYGDSPGYLDALSHLIESAAFTDLLKAYKTFLDLSAMRQDPDHENAAQEVTVAEDGRLILSVDEALQHYIQKLGTEMTLICGEELQPRAHRRKSGKRQTQKQDSEQES